MKIFKYRVQEKGKFSHSMPFGAKILSFQKVKSWSAEFLEMWALVDTEQDQQERNFVSVFTGEEFESEGLNYIGTAKCEGLVTHLFEIKPI